MKAGTMEGLIGAGINMKLADTPMRVYKEARRKGDLGTMERAMGYASELKDTAYEYKEHAEEELRKEMKETREEQQREREEQRKAQKETTEKLTAKAAQVRDGNDLSADTDKISQADSLVISPEGQKLLQENRPDSGGTLPDMEAPDLPAPTDTKSDIKFYSSAGTAVETAPAGMNVSVDA